MNKKWNSKSICDLILDGKIAIYNATQHDLAFFPPNQCRENRRQIKENAKPATIIKKNSPLEVRYQNYLFSSGDDFYLDSLDSETSKKYDAIIVSSHYAKKILSLRSRKRFSDDFLDRLYVLDLVRKGKEVVGFKGLVKVFPTKEPEVYLETIYTGERTSIVNCIFCINYYEDIEDIRNISDYVENISGDDYDMFDDLYRLKISLDGYLNFRECIS